jgi:hypothetical protein
MYITVYVPGKDAGSPRVHTERSSCASQPALECGAECLAPIRAPGLDECDGIDGPPPSSLDNWETSA